MKDLGSITLEPGERKEVKFKITPDKLDYYDKKMQYGVEPGEFIVMVGPSSADDVLLKQSFTVK